ncbi:hypothetical protein Z945_2338 [Sulfitobacter noctilucae]|uniref:hypothetical protein n=1 Tax=Sulfitobacter noctilucae TaxID=1342302 RepID=UPI000468F279|nr:hypothetical protein [Sulfitobacter noctilucae]KIN61346.1 hypothetical protein Z945_2338 [Sulfitobacter noctilucae]
MLVRRGTLGENRFGPDPESAAQRAAELAAGRLFHPDDTWFAVPKGLAKAGIVVLCGAVAIDVLVARSASAERARLAEIPVGGQNVLLGVPDSKGRWSDRAAGVWALNFSDEMNVSPVAQVTAGGGAGGVMLVHRDGVLHIEQVGVAPKSRRKEPQLPAGMAPDLKILVALPGFDPLAGVFADHRSDALEITVPVTPMQFEHENDFGKPMSFLRRFERAVNYECVADHEVGDGITALREPTPQEATDLVAHHKQQQTVGFGARQGCIGKAATSGTAYAVRDEKGMPLGFGKCSTLGVVTADKTCEFTFWLPQEHAITYRFAERHLSALREIDFYARTLLRDATVAQNSRNISVLRRLY